MIENLDFERRRKVVSLGGKCPFNCLHCYTYCNEYKNDTSDDIEKVVESLKNESFDIIYISGHRENFIDPDIGISLCERLFEEYQTDILITTRNIFNEDQRARMLELSEKMKKRNSFIYFCISIPSLDSYKKIETNPIIPSPSERINFLKQINEMGIVTLLTIRPLFPNEFIPTGECLNIISLCSQYTQAVISSGVVIDEKIKKRLMTFPEDYRYEPGLLMSCLNNPIDVEYVNVDNEINEIRKHCEKMGIPFFTNSMPAIDYIKSKK